MSEGEKQRKLAELDRLINDPLAKLDAHRVWTLLAEISPRPVPPAAAWTKQVGGMTPPEPPAFF